MRAAAAALFLSCVAVAQAPRTFSGVVVDERGAPLQGVAVCPFDTGKPWTSAAAACTSWNGSSAWRTGRCSSPGGARVRPGRRQEPAVDWYVEVLPPTELWPGRVGQILPEQMAFNLYSRGMGIRLAGGAASAAMWLPAEPFQVTLRRFREDNSARANGEHRGDTTIEGDQKEVTLKW